MLQGRYYIATHQKIVGTGVADGYCVLNSIAYQYGYVAAAERGVRNEQCSNKVLSLEGAKFIYDLLVSRGMKMEKTFQGLYKYGFSDDEIPQIFKALKVNYVIYAYENDRYTKKTEKILVPESTYYMGLCLSKGHCDAMLITSEEDESKLFYGQQPVFHQMCSQLDHDEQAAAQLTLLTLYKSIVAKINTDIPFEPNTIAIIAAYHNGNQDCQERIAPLLEIQNQFVECDLIGKNGEIKFKVLTDYDYKPSQKAQQYAEQVSKKNQDISSGPIPCIPNMQEISKEEYFKYLPNFKKQLAAVRETGQITANFSWPEHSYTATFPSMCGCMITIRHGNGCYNKSGILCKDTFCNFAKIENINKCYNKDCFFTPDCTCSINVCPMSHTTISRQICEQEHPKIKGLSCRAMHKIETKMNCIETTNQIKKEISEKQVGEQVYVEKSKQKDVYQKEKETFQNRRITPENNNKKVYSFIFSYDKFSRYVLMKHFSISSEIEKKSLDVDELPQWNGSRVYEGRHPLLRSINDNKHWKAHGWYSTMKNVISIGSKWTKERNMTSANIIAVRPNDAAYDVQYHNNNSNVIGKRISIHKSYILDYLKEALATDNKFFEPSTYIASNDSVYYPGVIEGLKTIPVLGRQGFIVFNNYFPRVGRHQYFSNEGYFDISLQDGQFMVNSHPLGNPTCYEHPVFSWPFQQSSSGQFKILVRFNAKIFDSILDKKNASLYYLQFHDPDYTPELYYQSEEDLINRVATVKKNPTNYPIYLTLIEESSVPISLYAETVSLSISYTRYVDAPDYNSSVINRQNYDNNFIQIPRKRAQLVGIELEYLQAYGISTTHLFDVVFKNQFIDSVLSNLIEKDIEKMGETTFVHKALSYLNAMYNYPDTPDIQQYLAGIYRQKAQIIVNRGDVAEQTNNIFKYFETKITNLFWLVFEHLEIKYYNYDRQRLGVPLEQEYENELYNSMISRRRGIISTIMYFVIFMSFSLIWVGVRRYYLAVQSTSCFFSMLWNLALQFENWMNRKHIKMRWICFFGFPLLCRLGAVYGWFTSFVWWEAGDMDITAFFLLFNILDMFTDFSITLCDNVADIGYYKLAFKMLYSVIFEDLRQSGFEVFGRLTWFTVALLCEAITEPRSKIYKRMFVKRLNGKLCQREVNRAQLDSGKAAWPEQPNDNCLSVQVGKAKTKIIFDTKQNRQLTNRVKQEIISTFKVDKVRTYEQSAPQISYQGVIKQFVSYQGTLLNCISALFNRQTGTQVAPNSIYIFRLGLWFNSIVARRIVDTHYKFYSVEEYMRDQKDKKKVKKYQLWWKDFCYLQSKTRARIFECFAKGNEYAYETENQKKITEARPRFICNPAGEFFLYSCTIVKSMFRHIKTVCPIIVSALNEDQLADKLKTYVKPHMTKTIAIDGSSHDSHQHISLMRIIEKPIVNELWTKATAKLGLNKAQLDIIKDHMLGDVATIKAYKKDGRKRSRVLQAKILGTTFSGHAVSTTFGNSLRVAAMTSFIFNSIGYPDVMFQKNKDVACFVAGDDVLIKCTEEAGTKFQEVFHQYYATSTDKKINHGFGQVCKKLNIGNFQYIDFLSKEGCFYQGRWWFRRIFSRVLNGSNCSDEKNITAREHTTYVGLGMMAYANNNLGVSRLAKERLRSGAPVTSNLQNMLEIDYKHTALLTDLPSQYSFLHSDWKIRNFIDNAYICQGEVFDVPMRYCGLQINEEEG